MRKGLFLIVRTVSYTHLDVYKRQTFDMAKKACDVLGEATADDIVTLESDNIPVSYTHLNRKGTKRNSYHALKGGAV